MAGAGTAAPDDEEPQRPVFTKEDVEKIRNTLDTFLKNAGLTCVLLVDQDGTLLSKAGESSTCGSATISRLIVGCFAATRQTARLLGEETFSVLYQQGERENIDLFMAGRRTVLAVLFEGGERLGMIRIYGHQVAAKLAEFFDEIARRGRRGERPPEPGAAAP